jgi:Iap family predicted aminopeptidase
MARSKPVDENGYADGRNAIEAENQKLRDQNYRLRLAIEEAARLIWIKPTEAEKILSKALEDC